MWNHISGFIRVLEDVYFFYLFIDDDDDFIIDPKLSPKK